MSRIFLVFPLLFTGCAAHTYSVSMGGQPPGDAHYVIVQTGAGGNMRVYDCRSAPAATDWKPTCVRAEMRDQPPSGN